MKKVFFAIAAGLFLATTSHAANDKGDNLILKVNGMVCSYCAQGIEKRLTSLPQTDKVYVNLGQKVVAVQAKPGQKFDLAKVKAEVVDAGYEVASIDLTAKTTAQIRSESKAK
jgi:periplasmic mercuric ion binding protein